MDTPTATSSNEPAAASGIQVRLANPRGFCAGVDRAIDVVQRALELFGVDRAVDQYEKLLLAGLRP